MFASAQACVMALAISVAYAFATAPALTQSQPHEETELPRTPGAQRVAREPLAQASMRTPACRLKPWCSTATSLFSGDPSWSSSAASWAPGRASLATCPRCIARAAQASRADCARAHLERTLAEVAATSQPGSRLAIGPLDNRAELSGSQRRRGVEDHPSSCVAREDSVEHQDVKVHVEVQAAEPLHIMPSSA
jgi:hypothetical protein